MQSDGPNGIHGAHKVTSVNSPVPPLGSLGCLISHQQIAMVPVVRSQEDDGDVLANINLSLGKTASLSRLSDQHSTLCHGKAPKPSSSAWIWLALASLSIFIDLSVARRKRSDY